MLQAPGLLGACPLDTKAGVLPALSVPLVGCEPGAGAACDPCNPFDPLQERYFIGNGHATQMKGAQQRGLLVVGDFRAVFFPVCVCALLSAGAGPCQLLLLLH